MLDNNGETRAQRARRRALHAARVATLSVALMGCDGHETEERPCLTMEDAADSEECCETMGGSWSGESCEVFSPIVEGPRVPPPMPA